MKSQDVDPGSQTAEPEIANLYRMVSLTSVRFLRL